MIRFRMYSKGISKYDLVGIIVPRAISSMAEAIMSRNVVSALQGFAVNSAADILKLLYKNKADEFKNRKLVSLTNKDLILILNKLGYKNNRDFTINKKDAPMTMNLNNGILMISMEKDYNPEIINYTKKLNSQITNMGRFTFISYQASGRNELEKTLNFIVKNAKNIDIYDNR